MNSKRYLSDPILTQLGNDPFPLTKLPLPEPIGKKRRTQATAIVALLTSVSYVTWRVLVTLNLAAWWISVPLIVLEIHATLGFAMLTVNLWDLDGLIPTAKRSCTELKTAVLIPTYNEPEEIILPTVAAAVSMQLPHDTWVLDDGNRPWLADLAQKLGARYVARPKHDHAKAGNVNYILPQINADLVAILDADHVASEDFLSNTVGYFDDPRVALVQTPQDFYNLDSFEHRDSYNEQRLFYRAFEPGRNRWNAAFCCGTGAIFRKTALEGVGGMATDTITEDIHTTLRLHRQGWRTVYHNEVLAHGLAAGNAEQYLSQRLRWGTGAMQLLRKENPMFVSGLTPMQRICYLTTLSGWFDAWRSLGYILAPVVVLWTGAVPIRASLAVFVPFFLVALLVQRYAMRRLCRGMAPQGISTVFELVRMPANLKATLYLLADHEHVFTVTSKGKTGDRRRRVRVPLLLWLLMVALGSTLVWTIATLLKLTPLQYDVPWLAYGSLIWLVVNGILLTAAIKRIRSERFGAERRAAVRFDVNSPAYLNNESVSLLDVSLTGAKVEAKSSAIGLHLGDYAVLSFRLDQHSYPVKVVIRGESSPKLTAGRQSQVLGVEYVGGQTQARAALALALFQTGHQPTIEPGSSKVA